MATAPQFCEGSHVAIQCGLRYYRGVVVEELKGLFLVQTRHRGRFWRRECDVFTTAEGALRELQTLVELEQLPGRA